MWLCHLAQYKNTFYVVLRIWVWKISCTAALSVKILKPCQIKSNILILTKVKKKIVVNKVNINSFSMCHHCSRYNF